jgi:hypothetical protein
MTLMEMLYWQEILQKAEHQIVTWGQLQTEGEAAECQSTVAPNNGLNISQGLKARYRVQRENY